MEAGLNCSSHCESGVCFINAGVNSQQAWDVLQRLCALTASSVDVQSRSLSPALRAVVWTLLSCGILLALFFLIFTLRFKNNRIVKMSSPNLNVLTLCGSVLTYSSGFLFAIEEKSLLSGAGAGARAVLQARMWTLCIGSSLVFGPILGKTWRLYRVFTQRVPDKRVIIRDIQLMGLVALLVLVDVVVLTAWGLMDPAKCSRSVSAMVKVIDLDSSYSLSQLDSCSSLYSHLWIILISVLKGSLLLYGTYLAGLTSNVSLPPVNQSKTIMGAVCLVTMSSAVAVPISLYLYSWPNVVYSVISGAIFICTMAINCLLFVPQLTQWRHFEEETNSHPSQMAKYFSSPSKTTNSMYSEDEIYYLLGENDSMKRLINEKNAVIDSLQEQVNNAKDKLLKLMTASQLLDEREMDSSNTNLNSTSTQTTVVSPDSPTLVLKQYSEVAPTRVLSPPPYVPPPPIPIHTTSSATSPEGPGATDKSSPHLRTQGNSSLEVVSLKGNIEDNIRYSGLGKEISEKPQDVPLDHGKLAEDFPPPVSAQCNSPQVESPVPSASVELPAISPAGRLGFVTNEQLVEILQDLSIDAVSSSVKSPDRARSPSINPDELSMTLSPQSPLQFFFPPISPYVMRKRRPPFYSSKGGPPPYYFPGSVPPGRRRGLPDLEKFRDDDPKTSSTGNPQRHDLLREERRSKRAEKAQTRSSSGQDSWECSSHKCSITPFMGHVPQPASAGLIEEVKHSKEPYDYSDSDSSSSEDYFYYQRSYCRACHHPYDSTDSLTSGTSDSEDEDFYRSSHPIVNFKVDVKPTFV